MIVTAWNNGSHHKSGAGYGIKVSIKDRDNYFDSGWSFIQLFLGDSKDSFSVNTAKKSFWNDTCHELISKDIGQWLIDQGLAPWPKGNPPKLKLTMLDGNQFRLARE